MNRMKKEIKKLKEETIRQKKLDRLTFASETDELFFIEQWVDGFGNDTYVDRVFPTLQQAQAYVLKAYPEFNCAIIGGRFGEEIEQHWS